MPREHGGARALWRGHMCSLLRVVPTLSLSLVLGETFRSIFADPLAELGLTHSAAANLAANTAAGGLAAAAALAVVYPLDLARACRAVPCRAVPCGRAGVRCGSCRGNTTD